MKRKTIIRSTKQHAIGNIFGGVLFIGFGIFSYLKISSFGGDGYNYLFLLVCGAGGLFGLISGIIQLTKGGFAEHEIITDYPEEEASSASPDKQLRQLRALYDDGILTKEEYETKKAKILNERW